MIKLWGGVCVVFGCTALGWLKALRLKEDVKICTGFITALEIIRRDIQHYHRDIPSLCANLQNTMPTSVGDYFQGVRRHLLQEEDGLFSQFWVEELEKEPLFSSELTEILLPLGHILGQYDTVLQSDAIGVAIQSLKGLKKVRNEVNKKSIRVYESLGLTSGLFLLILLL